MSVRFFGDYARRQALPQRLRIPKRGVEEKEDMGIAPPPSTTPQQLDRNGKPPTIQLNLQEMLSSARLDPEVDH